MQQNFKLLIVEDEPAILQGLTDVFDYHCYEVDGVADGQQGLELALSSCYDLILLDVMLPSLDGFTVCNEIRTVDTDLPIIMLTSKTHEVDIITGLSLGADDYVAKPFSVRELVLRVEAVLKRSRKLKHTKTVLVVGNNLEIDTRNLVARSNDSNAPPLRFTRREIEILQYLQLHTERPVPRQELLETVWGYQQSANIETRTVDIHIAKLRRKIEPDPTNPVNLVTLRWEGYRLRC